MKLPTLMNLRHSLLPLFLIAPSFVIGDGHAAIAQVPPTWKQTWNSPFNHSDSALLVRAAGAGGILQLASAHDPMSGAERLVLIRYETDGHLAWQQVDTTISPFRAIDLMIAEDGSAVLAGTSGNILIVRKFDSVSGDLVWERQRILQTSSSAISIGGPKLARDNGGDRILVAVSDQDDFLIARYAEDGTPGADVRWGVENSVDVPTAIIARADGGFVVSGYEGGTVHAAYRTLRFDAAGAQQFSDRETGAIGNLFTPAWLAQDSDGNTYVAGGPESTCGLFTFRVWKLDADGKRLWTHSGPTTPCATAEPIGFALLADGSTIVVNQTGLSYFGVVRLNADGSTRWARQWGGPNGLHSVTPYAFAVDASGRTRVTGMLSSGSTGTFVIAEWTPEGGLCVAGTDSASRGIAIQSLGTGWVVAANSIFNPTTNQDAMVLRYPAATQCTEDALFADAFEQGNIF